MCQNLPCTLNLCMYIYGDHLLNTKPLTLACTWLCTLLDIFCWPKVSKIWLGDNRFAFVQYTGKQVMQKSDKIYKNVDGLKNF